jgi:hypothetical protein
MRGIFHRSVSGIMVLLVLLGSILPLVSAEELISNPLDELLPPRIYNPGHDPTYPLQEPEWYFGTSWSETLSEPGFVEGKAEGFYKRFFAHSDMSVEFYVYRFSNASSAEAYCSKEINEIKSEGEYSEVHISGAFAVVYDYGTQEIGVSWGVIHNIVFKVGVYTGQIVEDPTEELVSFTIYERELLSEVGVIIPEFPSFIILPLFITATVLAIIFSRRQKSRYH